MAYFPALSPFRHGLEPVRWGADGPPGVEPADLYWWPGDGLGEGAFAVPELNVGWLDPPHEFPRAPMEPELVEKLQRLCTESRYRMMRGFHPCGFCHEAHDSGEIRIAGNNVVYAAPRLIAHYVAAHQSSAISRRGFGRSWRKVIVTQRFPTFRWPNRATM